jgi:hypothetical protein
MSIVQAAQRAAAATDYMAQGIHCHFCRLRHHPNLGAKFYRRKDVRDNNWRLQGLAAKYGLAPKVLFTFEVDEHPAEHVNGQGYAYITECVTEVWCDRSERLHWRDYDNDDPRYAWNRIQVESKKLQAKLEALGIVVLDLDNSGNLGWLPDGRLVCIDFGNMFYASDTVLPMDERIRVDWLSRNPDVPLDKLESCAILY